MKKNKSMRFASFLLVATLITTSIISGTFAKYTTKADAADTARIAKWGVVASMSDSVFGKKYSNVSEGNGITTSNNSADFSVLSEDSSNLVAPGTKNEEFEYSVTGKPEVDGKIKVRVDGTNISLSAGTYAEMVKVESTEVNKNDFDAGEYYIKGKADSSDVYVIANTYKNGGASVPFNQKGDYYKAEIRFVLDSAYYPVVFSLKKNGSNGEKVNVVTTSADADSLAVVADYFLKNDSLFLAGKDIADANLPQISWEWKFCNLHDDKGNSTPCDGYDITTSGNVACKYCQADTILGNAMAGINEVDIVNLSSSNSWTSIGDFYRLANEHCTKNLSFNIKMAVTQED